MLTTRESSLGVLDPGLVPGTILPGPDGEHLAYVAIVPVSPRATIMPWERPVWEDDIAPRRRVLESFTVILDGDPGVSFEEVGRLVFSPDGSRLAYAARDDDEWKVVVD